MTADRQQLLDKLTERIERLLDDPTLPRTIHEMLYHAMEKAADETTENIAALLDRIEAEDRKFNERRRH